jgi:methylenetetrahydrofolate--tRNA-(uracil-5-)-methyltransferase
MPAPAALQIVGGGLAGCEAAWQAAESGARVILCEMRPLRATAAHVTDALAELVCSNSFRSDDHENNAVGLLHEEMRRAGSLVLRSADEHRLPAGGALAVDREGFSRAVTCAIETHPLIEIRREEVTGLPEGPAIIATGPLTSDALAQSIRAVTGEESLAFFDAIAPVVYRDSIDFSIAWFQSRYDKHGPEGGADYINCPLDEQQYRSFVAALISGEKASFKEWESSTPYFEGCLPVEVMAERGAETLRFGPMKPVGLKDSRRENRPYAVVQLRQDNALGSLWNMVGFQTKLKHSEQVRIFRMIPGLREAQFARLGGLHRNTFVNSPRLLDGQLRLASHPHIRFAGQITGVEGYVESAAMGLLAGRSAAAEMLGRNAIPPPPTTALGSLLHHITSAADPELFQPMNVNFGLFPALADGGRGRDRKRALSRRALRDLASWLPELATMPDVTDAVAAQRAAV